VTPASFASPDAEERRSSRRLLRVLVVDNQPDTVTSLLAILRDEGYDARGVVDPRTALVELGAFDPDVVIADIAMPHITGWDIAREIRSMEGRRRPLLIAITGVYVKSPDEMLSRAAGFDHFLTKPCDPAFLLNILAAVIPK